MKHLLLTTIAAVLLAGCGEAQPPEPPTAKAPDISIHKAAIIGNTEAIQQHLAAGTDVNAKAGGGDTPLDWAIMGKRTGAADLLRKHGGMMVEELRSGMTPLHAAARKGLKEVVELLIHEGTDVNAKSDDGWTPLHLAAARGHKEIVEQLIAKGADVNAKTDDGKTTLDLAILRKRTETGALLHKHGGKTGEELKAEGAK
jgi:cytohesin